MKHYNSIQEIKAEVVKLLQERIALINVDQNKYKLTEDKKGERQVVSVTYDGIKILTVEPFISNVRENGRLQVRGILSIRAVFDDYWYDNDDIDTDIFVDEYLRCQFNNLSTTFDKLLEVLMPLADEGKVKRICEELDKIGFRDISVNYDTYGYKYVVEGEIHTFLYNDNK